MKPKFTSNSNLNEKTWKIIKSGKFMKVYIKMEKTIIKLGDIKIKKKKKKKKTRHHKSPILKSEADIYKIVVSTKVSFGRKGFKYFIGYKDV